MSAHAMRFTEIEHKFVVGDSFDVDAFRSAVESLAPVRRTRIAVRDCYYLTPDGTARGYLLRHRLDAELQQVTIKSFGADSETRHEVNLDLGLHAGDQTPQVEAFVGLLGAHWTGRIDKQVEVWYFDDCEVVHYTAQAGPRRVACVEFEARGQASLASALAVIGRFEQATGFGAAERSHRSLPQLLFDGFPNELVNPEPR